MKLSQELRHVLLRPSMYVGMEKDQGAALAWLVNGFVLARQGFMNGTILDDGLFVADSAKTIDENGKLFLERIEKFENA